MDEHEDGYADPYLDDYLSGDDIWDVDELRDYDEFGDCDELDYGYDELGYCGCEWCEGHYE